MIIGVDIGASKTLVAAFTDSETIQESTKFETPTDPAQLVEKINEVIAALVPAETIDAIGIASAGYVQDGTVTHASLDWHNAPLLELLRETHSIPISLENDAVVGGLAEAHVGHGQYCTNLLYISASTGVGTGIILNGAIPKAIRGSEAGHMFAVRNGDPQRLEDLVSGVAFKHRFGKYGYEVSDPTIWAQYAEDLAYGLYNMSALLEPDRVVIGGGMAVHFDLFEEPLVHKMAAIHNGIFPLPEIVQAKYPETAVAYGCAILAQEVLQS